jgi:transposase
MQYQLPFQSIKLCFAKTLLGSGRSDVRAALYMSTLVAVRLNPSLREFHQRLRRAGKSQKMALTACMRR